MDTTISTETLESICPSNATSIKIEPPAKQVDGFEGLYKSPEIENMFQPNTENEEKPSSQIIVPEQMQQQPRPRQFRNRMNLKPKATIKVFTISSEMIKTFIQQKAKFYVPDAATSVSIFCSDSKRGNDKKRYASARITFTDAVTTAKTEDKTWFDNIGGNGNVHFIDQVYVNIVKRYMYDKTEINNIRRNYKKMSHFEDDLGITEEFLDNIRMYATPKRIDTGSRNSLIVFSARVEPIIEDILSDPETGKLDGSIEIKEVYENREVVYFTIYVHPKMHKNEINPYVKELVESVNGVKVY